MLKKYIYVFLISMLPIIELRGAIIVGAGLGLDMFLTYSICVVGNFLPVPFILLFIRRILAWMKTTKTFGRLALWIERKAYKNKGKVIKENSESLSEGVNASESETVKRNKIMRGVAVGLFLFVAIPLPGTGAWTGALIASLTDMRMKYALPAIFAGVLVAGVIMTLVSFGIVGFLSFRI